MRKWSAVPLEELYAEPSRNGLNRPKSVRGSGYRMINMGEIFAYDRIGDVQMDRVQMNDEELTKFSVLEGDLLFARQSLVLAGAGKCSIVRASSEITTFESHLIRVRLDPDKGCPEFYFYYFKSPTGKANVQSLVMQVAAAGIRGSELAKLRVPAPPLPIQRRIASILSAYDDLIENNQRRIKILEEMAQLLYREWFVNFRFPGHEKVRMVDSPLGKIPEGWEVKSAKEVAEVVYGFAFASNRFNTEQRGMPLVRIRDIPGGRSETYTDEEVDSKYLIGDGDLLVGMDGDFHMNIWSSGPAVQNQRVARFMPKPGVGRELLFLLLQKPILDLNRAIVGTTVAHLGDSHIQRILVPVADVATMKRANEVLEPIGQEVLLLRKQNANLRRTRDLLLPRLLSGQLPVEPEEG